jgi:hypothetical protein
MPSSAYQSRILNAVDTCNNCYRLVRVDRQQRPEDRRGDVSVKEADYSRRTRTTTVEFAPADTASASKGVFCACGVEGSYERVWSGDDIGRPRFRTFVKRVIRTLERKGITVDRQAFASAALNAYEPLPRPAGVADVDEWLAAGLDAGRRAATFGNSERHAAAD